LSFCGNGSGGDLKESALSKFLLETIFVGSKNKLWSKELWLKFIKYNKTKNYVKENLF